MTDAERLAKIREWTQGEQSPAPVMTEYLDGFAEGYGCAQESVLDILDEQPDPHPLGSVRFDEATEEQFKEFWEAAGFVIKGSENEGTWADKLVNGFPDELTVFPRGNLTLYAGGTEFFLGRLATFQEALDALNELAATKIMGGWA
jgi:hypothetical protein